MPVTVQLLPDEPIVVLTLEGKITAAELRLMFEEYHRATKQIDDLIYRVANIRYADGDFAELLTLMDDTERRFFDARLDDRVRVVFVGSDEMARRANQATNQALFVVEGETVFTSVEDALQFAREQLTELI
ncbi:MAG: hypothetical protein D6737_05075 [Chloroflexi bacterium]|nr:MAG: hypothetical protein D6737_05075 [Chloroflexota bacterium]